MMLLIFTMILQKKVKKIAESRQTSSRQIFLDIINSLKETFNELPDTTDMPDLESEESVAERRKKRTRIKNTNTKPNA